MPRSSLHSTSGKSSLHESTPLTSMSFNRAKENHPIKNLPSLNSKSQQFSGPTNKSIGSSSKEYGKMIDIWIEVSEILTFCFTSCNI